jgi:iron complex outermembrane recepter protein
MAIDWCSLSIFSYRLGESSKMMKRKLLSVLVGQAFGAAVVTAVALPAYAQEEQSQVPVPTQMQKIVVVGSNIPRSEQEGAVPVVILKREDIEKTAASTVQELIQNLNIAGSQGFNTGASGSFVTGASSTGFRGLPASDTLVLLNGRRLAPYGKSQQSTSGGAVAFVDLNSIPLSAVEEVQLLKDGASAIYGADAIAGVLNIVTKKNYQGAEANVRYGAYGDPGGAEKSVNATIGFGDLENDRFNVILSAEGSQIDEIWNKDRPFTRTYDYRGYSPQLGDYRSSYSNYGNYDPDGAGYQAGSNCPSQYLRGGLCRYDFGDVEQVQPATDRMSGMLIGNLKITDDLFGFTELGYNRNKTVSASRAPALTTESDLVKVDAYRGLALGTTQNLVNHALATQYNALGTDPLGIGSGLTTLDVRQRFTEYGPREDEITAESLRYVFGLKGTVKEWNWEAAYVGSEQTIKTISRNEIRTDLLADLLVAGAVTNIFSDPANKGGYGSTKFIGSEENKSKLQTWDFKANAEVLQLPAGPLGVAFGGEYRKESMSTTTDPYTEAGLRLGSASVATTGDRDLKSFFGEVNIPIVKMLETQLAVRQDRYSDFGSTTNPKVAVRFQPVKSLMFRGSYGTAFKAPTLFQLYENQASGGYNELIDSKRCDVTGLPADCDARLIEVRSGGVKPLGLSLKPEESKNYNLGFVLSPSSDFSVGMDYWIIQKKNAIGLVDAQNAIDAGSPAVIRGASAGGVPGEIVRVISTYVNAAKQELSGIDFDLNAKTQLPIGGTLGSGVSFTYTIKFDQWAADGAQVEHLVGNYTYFEVPRVKGQFRVTYDIGPWALASFVNYTGGYSNEVSAQSGAQSGQNRVAPYSTVDLTGAYKVDKAMTIHVGVRNLFDEKPAIIAGVGGPATDAALYDLRGRFMYASLNYIFK